MKSISHLLITALLLLMHIESLAMSATYQFQFNYQHLENNNPATSPKIVEAHGLSINGVKMSVFNTTFENPNEMSVLSYRAKALPSKIKAEYLKKFDLYGMPNGNVFVPREWHLVYANLAKNDALTYTFVPPDGKDGYLSFTHTANCLPCAASEASLFFSDAAKEARKTNQQSYLTSNIPMAIVPLKQHLVTYRIMRGEQRIDGVAYYNPQAALPFWKVEVSLDSSESELSNPLLNQFIMLYE